MSLHHVFPVLNTLSSAHCSTAPTRAGAAPYKVMPSVVLGTPLARCPAAISQSLSCRSSNSRNSSRLHPTQPFTKIRTAAANRTDRTLSDAAALRILSNTASSTTGSSSNGNSNITNPFQGLSTFWQGVIDPNNPVYKAWRGFLIGAAAFTGVFIPWELGFCDLDHFYILDNWAAWIDLALVLLFMVDLGVNHLVSYETDELLVDEPGAEASNYRRQRLALDLISAVPFDWIAYGATAAAVATAAATASPEAADVMMQTQAAAAAASVPAAAAAGGGLLPSSVAEALPAIACLKALHLVRLYRVRWFFRYLEYDLTVSLLTVTVARNLVIVLYLTHWVACGFNFLARSQGYDPDLLVGLNSQLFTSISAPEQYLYSLYWSVTTLAGNEWNGMDTVHDMRQVAANTFRASVFLLFNIALGAYILGTITLLVVKNDERTGRYRDLSSNLKTYSLLNRLPPELKDEMQEHLRMNFNHQEASDDQVLSIYPTTIRRRILRHLYLRHLRGSYLFRGTPRKYLDALLAASRLELFRPGVDLLSAGDVVNELFVVVSGKVELRSPLDPAVSQYDWGGDYTHGDPLTSLDPLSSMMGEHDPDLTAAAAAAGAAAAVYMGPTRVLGPGELFGEISFFTEIPQMETVRSLSSVRVMVISRSAFESIERNFPIASRLVLENLKRRSEQQVSVEFPGLSGNRVALQQLLSSCPSSLMYSWASPELVELMMSGDMPSSAPADFGPEGSPYSTTSSASSVDYDAAASSSSSSGSSDGYNATVSMRPVSAAAAAAERNARSLAFGSSSSSSSSKLSARQELVLSNLVRVMAVINQHLAKQDEDRTTEFLYAATRGDVVRLRNMLQQGFNPDSADYDGRTALMLACVRGHREVVELLIAAGADARLIDNMGRSALLEACYFGHDNIIDMLVFSGIKLTPAGTPGSSSSSSSMRLTTSGSAASNISGSSSSSSNKITRFSNNTLDPAAAGRFGSLSGSSSSSDAAAAAAVNSAGGSHTSWGLQLASLLCNCVYECNLPLLRRLLRAGAPVDIGDYDRRTALHISSAEGNLVMLRVLVEEGGASLSVRDRWGNSPLDEARRVGAQLVVTYLEAAAAAAAAAASTDPAAAAAAAAASGSNPESLFSFHNSPGGLRNSFTKGSSSSGSSTDEVPTSSSSTAASSSSRRPHPVSRQQLEQQEQAAAAAELQRQQQLQAKQVRAVSSRRSALSRPTGSSTAAAAAVGGGDVDAVQQLMRLADRAHKRLLVTASEIDSDLAEKNAARVEQVQDVGSSSSSSSNNVVSAARIAKPSTSSSTRTAQ